mmetsp:Transcript_34301/g.87102  ORF Transcript_34301/g.87102 Transcript_34301/m.87102 type:complete len:103 (-) Transcript_34301:7-315(-)
MPSCFRLHVQEIWPRLRNAFSIVFRELDGERATTEEFELAWEGCRREMHTESFALLEFSGAVLPWLFSACGIRPQGPTTRAARGEAWRSERNNSMQALHHVL